MQTGREFGDGPEGCSMEERLDMLQEVLFVRHDMPALSDFSPLEVYEVLLRCGEGDEETIHSLVNHISICAEVGRAFLHPGSEGSPGSIAEDESFVTETLRAVFPELEPDAP